MTHFDRFERDLLRNFWFGFIVTFIPSTGGAFVVEFVSASIFGFPLSVTAREMLPYIIGISVAVAVVGTLCEELVDLRRDVEQLKLANSAQLRE